MARLRKGDPKILAALTELSRRAGKVFSRGVVKGDLFDLPNALDLIEVSEARGIIPPVGAERLRLYIHRKWIAYETQDLPQNFGLKSRDFAPSYDEPDQDTYAKRVRGARERAQSDAEGYHASRDKREAHYSLPGGREALRYPDALGPAETRRERPESRAALISTEKRLAGLEQPYAARTQSPETRSRKNGGDYREQVKEALERATHGLVVWTVPSDPEGLTRYGMPVKEAKVLVDRAANRSFMVEDLTPPTGDVRFLARPLPKGWPPLSSQVETCLKITFATVDDELLADPWPHPKRLREEERQIVDQGTRKRHVPGRPPGGYPHPQAPIPSRSALVRVEADGKEIIGKAWFAKHADGWFGAEDVFRFVQGQIDRMRASSLTIVFDRGGSRYQSTLKVEQVTDDSGREHSKLACRGVPKNRIDYRTLKGASLSDLPDLLCRITRRPNPTSARRNPMANWWDSYQYDLDPEFALGPIGPRASRPTSRRNTSKSKSSKGNKSMRKSAKSNRGRPVTRFGTWQKFCAHYMKNGYTMKEAARAWKIHKKGGSAASHKKAWGKVRAAKKRTTAARRRSAASSRRSSRTGIATKRAVMKEAARLVRAGKSRSAALKAAWKSKGK